MKISEIEKLAEILSRGQRASVGEAARPKYSGRMDCREAYKTNNPKRKAFAKYTSPNKVGP